MRRIVCIAFPHIRAEIAAEQGGRPVAQGFIVRAFERLAEVALAFGPAVAFDVDRGVVWLDVTGCAHLQGGEAQLAASIDERVRSLGHGSRLAIADGPRIAAAVACFAPSGQAGPFIVPQGKGLATVRALPIAALGLDDDVVTWLHDLGMESCGDLQKLPARSLGLRLGARVRDVMEILSGNDPAPLDAWRPPPMPEERVELEWGAQSVEALSFVVKALCDRIAARLAGRAMAAEQLELVLTLDRALCGQASSIASIEVTLPSPLALAADLRAVLRTRLESVSLAAPVLAVTLRATKLARVTARNLDMLSPEPKADRALPRLVAELAAELGDNQVGILALADTWVARERTRLVPFRAAPAKHLHPLTTSALEPTRLVELSSVPTVPVERQAEATLLLRVEAVEWWKRDVTTRDARAVWLEDAGVLAWIEGGQICGWVD